MTEKILFLIDIVDNKAVRFAKQHTLLPVDSDDLCFVAPGEIKEFNPEKIVHVFHDSVLFHDDIAPFIPRSYNTDIDPFYLIGDLLESGNQYIALYCAGVNLQDIAKLTEDYAWTEIFQNEQFNMDYYSKNDIILFSKILYSVREVEVDRPNDESDDDAPYYRYNIN